MNRSNLNKEKENTLCREREGEWGLEEEVCDLGRIERVCARSNGLCSNGLGWAGMGWVNLFQLAKQTKYYTFGPFWVGFSLGTVNLFLLTK